MRIAVVGPGALGCLFASSLAESGKEVLLLDHRPERADFINRRGITVERNGQEHRIKMRVSASPVDIAGSELIIMCVKAYQTQQAIEPLVQFISPASKVLTLQNGLGNVEALVEVCGEERVWGGVTAQGATELGLGQIRHGGMGDTSIASVVESGQEEQLAHTAEIFNKASLKTNVVESYQSLIWSKVIINVGINPLTAATRLRNGQLLEYNGTEDIMEDAVKEATAVADALNIKLLYPNALERVRQVAEATYSNRASMLQDVLAKRKTEIDYINGAIAARGRECGIPTPVNDTLARLVKTLEESYGKGVLPD